MAGHHITARGLIGIVLVAGLVAACGGGAGTAAEAAPPKNTATGPVEVACDVLTTDDLAGFLGHPVVAQTEEADPIVYLGVELSHCGYEWASEYGTIDMFLLTAPMAATMTEDDIAMACPGFAWGAPRPSALFDCQNNKYHFEPGDEVLSIDRPTDAVAAYVPLQALDGNMVRLGQFGVTTDAATIWLYVKGYTPVMSSVDADALLHRMHDRLTG